MSELLRVLRTLSASDRERIDQLCDGFEQAWEQAQGRGGERPHLEQCLACLAEPVRLAAFCCLLEIEQAYRSSQGECITRQEYHSRFPEYAAWIDRILCPLPNRAGAWPPDIPGYQIHTKLQEGGMGIVWLASHYYPTPAQPLMPVVLKTIRPQFAAWPDYHELFLKEMRRNAGVKHAHVVPILSVCPPESPILYYAMPYMAGGDLGDRINGTPVPSENVEKVLKAIVEAVAYLHRQGIVHCDLKPANILLDDEDTPHVSDFGLAHLLPPDGRTYITENLGGTLPYAAPEQLKGQVSQQCDIYSIGAILYEMLTGKPPFRGATAEETRELVADMDLEPVPPRSLNPSVDLGLQAICLKCLEKNPADRYGSAKELQKDVELYLNEQRPRAQDPSLFQWLRRHLRREIRFEEASRWSAVMLWEASLSFLAHTSLYVLLRTQPSASLCWLWLLIVVLLAEWGPWVLMRIRWYMEPKEREILLFWCGVAAAKFILFAQHCPLTGPVEAHELLKFYPGWMAIHGLMLFVEGRLYWGWLYLVGLADFLCAFLLSWRLDLAPILFAVWNSSTLILIAVRLRRRAAALRLSKS